MTQCGFWNLPYGANEHKKHGACFPEPLHQMCKGPMENAIECTVEMVQAHATPRMVAEFDRRFQELDPSRNSDRVTIPISTFPRGE